MIFCMGFSCKSFLFFSELQYGMLFSIHWHCITVLESWFFYLSCSAVCSVHVGFASACMYVITLWYLWSLALGRYLENHIESYLVTCWQIWNGWSFQWWRWWWMHECLMNFWGTFDEFLMYLLCISYAFLMHFLCTFYALLMHFLCTLKSA
jgi:hypothetical protein